MGIGSKRLRRHVHSDAFVAAFRIACGQTTQVLALQPPAWTPETGYFTGGTAHTDTTLITTGTAPGAAPQAIYQSQRWGQFSYTIAGLAASATYKIRLHFAELYYSAAGQRVMNITANNQLVIQGFDIFVAAGGANRACTKDFTINSTPAGQIVIEFNATSPGGDAKVCGIELAGTIPASDTPRNLTASAAQTYVTLSWSPPTFPSGAIQGYNIYQNGSQTPLNNTPIQATTYKPGQESPALAPSTQYTFSVKTVIGGTEKAAASVVVTTNALVQLLFEDTFAGTSLDQSKWVIESFPAGTTNNELQSYGNPAAFSVANNTLTISARRDGNGNWYSGRIHAAEQYALYYGRLEAELKLPSIKGAWPAFWTWALYGGGWPGGGEIDVVESINAESIIYSNLHYSQGGGHGQSGPHATPIDITQWHTYAAEVRPGYVEFFIDGVSTVKWTQSQIQASGGNWPFGTVKQGVTLNLAIGGVWPGVAPDPSVTLIQMQVRNVRIYP